jgi:hypothetical protein
MWSPGQVVGCQTHWFDLLTNQLLLLFVVSGQMVKVNQIIQSLAGGLIGGKGSGRVLVYFLIISSPILYSFFIDFMNILVSPKYATLLGLTKTEHDVSQCGFTNAAGSGQADHLPGWNIEVDASKQWPQSANFEGLVAVGDVLKFNY